MVQLFFEAKERVILLLLDNCFAIGYDFSFGHDGITSGSLEDSTRIVMDVL